MKAISIDKTKVQYLGKQYALIVLSAFISAVNINTFLEIGGIIPGGFTGVSLLFIESVSRYGKVTIPFSVVYYILNIIPLYIGFRFIGKWFTFYSCVIVFLTGLFADLMPAFIVEFFRRDLHDKLVCAIFGGILSAFCSTLSLNADTTSGGTDLIAIFISEKKCKDAWSYIFIGNCVVLVLAACLFDVEKALYSIISQFTTTTGLNFMYKGYQQKTLLIITDKSEEIYQLIRDVSHHDATSFTGIGRYKNTERTMLYSVVSSSDVPALLAGIKEIDPHSFVNVLKTDTIIGLFYRRPKF